MDGTPHLLTDVKFTQLRKGGYDPEEVDNYLERINDAVSKLADNLRGATDRAETAESQLADARRAQSDAEAELERVRGGGLVSTSGSGEEEVAKVLVLAQRAADEATQEAEAAAAKTVADARAKAVNMLADAEQERERLLIKARKKADAVAEERAKALHEQVDLLASARADLEADVVALTAHLDGERDRLRERVESILVALEDPATLRVAPGPELNDTPIPTLDLPGDEPPSPFAPTQPVSITEAATDAPAATESTGSSDVIEGIDESDAADESGTADESAPEEPEAIDAEPWNDEAADDTIYLDAPADDAEAAGADASDADEAAEQEAEGGSGLFDESSDKTPSSPTSELFGSDDDVLGPPDEEADAAMRAFFERDLDDPAASARGRFGRRR
jgi:cell division initiation protein